MSLGSLRDVECYYCHKKGHLKPDCRGWQRDKKKLNEEKSDSATKPKSNVKIEELNVVESLTMLTMSENMPTMDILCIHSRS